MGELGGFLKIDRAAAARARPARARRATTASSCGTLPLRRAARARARAAWSAASRSATTAARSGNLIPDWNDLVYRDRWREAIDQLHATNNFPEFTGRLCPAPVRGRVRARDPRGRRGHDQADRGLDHQPRLGGGLGRAAAAARARPAAASPSSAPAPPASPRAQQLRRAGHRVDALRARRGGRRARALRRARLQDREARRRAPRRSSSSPRASSSAAASTSASTSTGDELREQFDAVVLATGSRVPRDLPVPGRELDGVHFAMEYLYERNRWVARRRARAARRRPRAAVDHRRRQARRS